MTQIAIMTYPGFTALDFIGPWCCRWLPDAESASCGTNPARSPPTPAC